MVFMQDRAESKKKPFPDALDGAGKGFFLLSVPRFLKQPASAIKAWKRIPCLVPYPPTLVIKNKKSGNTFENN
jgi:hypothetical protein